MSETLIDTWGMEVDSSVSSVWSLLSSADLLTILESSNGDADSAIGTEIQ